MRRAEVEQAWLQRTPSRARKRDGHVTGVPSAVHANETATAVLPRIASSGGPHPFHYWERRVFPCIFQERAGVRTHAGVAARALPAGGAPPRGRRLPAPSRCVKRCWGSALLRRRGSPGKPVQTVPFEMRGRGKRLPFVLPSEP